MKFVFWFFIVSLVACLLINLIGFFAEKFLKKKMERVAKKDD